MTSKLNKLTITIFLAIFSTGAMTEYTFIGKNKMTTLYVDIASISRSGNIARMCSMYDFPAPIVTKFGSVLSMVNSFEYDCVNKMKNSLSTTIYNENMMDDKVFETSKNVNKDWSYIAPRTLEEREWKIACGKK